MKILRLTSFIIICYYVINKFLNRNRIGNITDAKWILKRLEQGKDI
jgi:hypothetical protein